MFSNGDGGRIVRETSIRTPAPGINRSVRLIPTPLTSSLYFYQSKTKRDYPKKFDNNGKLPYKNQKIAIDGKIRALYDKSTPMFEILDYVRNRTSGFPFDFIDANINSEAQESLEQMQANLDK